VHGADGAAVAAVGQTAPPRSSGRAFWTFEKNREQLRRHRASPSRDGAPRFESPKCSGQKIEAARLTDGSNRRAIRTVHSTGIRNPSPNKRGIRNREMNGRNCALCATNHGVTEKLAKSGQDLLDRRRAGHHPRR